MDLSTRTTRRGIVALAATLVTLRAAPAQAQTTSPTGCSIGFINGLLRISPDCPLLAPAGAHMAGMAFSVAPPTHLLAQEAVAVEGAVLPRDERVARLLEARERQDQKRRRRKDRRVKRRAR